MSKLDISIWEMWRELPVSFRLIVIGQAILYGAAVVVVLHFIRKLW